VTVLERDLLADSTGEPHCRGDVEIDRQFHLAFYLMIGQQLTVFKDAYFLENHQIAVHAHRSCSKYCYGREE